MVRTIKHSSIGTECPTSPIPSPTSNRPRRDPGENYQHETFNKPDTLINFAHHPKVDTIG
jgi:hypothetical protein